VGLNGDITERCLNGEMLNGVVNGEVVKRRGG
jgi:hypothetical protein